jgi:hypothetical protein
MLLSGDSGRYDLQANLEIHKQLRLERRPDLVSPRMPWYDAAFRWLTSFPIDQAIWVWRLLNIVSLALFAAMFPFDRMKTYLAVLISSPVLQGIIMGQDIGIVMLFLSCSLVLERKGFAFLSGLSLCLCSAKWHFFILPAACLLHYRKWRTAQGLAVGAAALLSISTFVQGPGWFAAYYARISNHSEWVAAKGVMINFAALFQPDSLARYTACLAAVVLFWVVIHRYEFMTGFAVAIIVNIVISSHSYMHDAALMIPGLMLLSLHSRFLNVLCWLQLIPWQMPVVFLNLMWLQILGFKQDKVEVFYFVILAAIAMSSMTIISAALHKQSS